LKDAVRDRRSFNPRTGLPGAGAADGEPVTWYAHARSYAEAKWPKRDELRLMQHCSL
jgi:hypothetical protein